ncbi:hypothetical protein ACFRDV_30275 [Streptomyces fagopyri]|uniref:hypothetical protein n=1 Tax=Streptomyces fagopyri TaxID=2662397 RepID=UPI0036A14755
MNTAPALTAPAGTGTPAVTHAPAADSPANTLARTGGSARTDARTTPSPANSATRPGSSADPDISIVRRHANVPAVTGTSTSPAAADAGAGAGRQPLFAPYTSLGAYTRAVAGGRGPLPVFTGPRTDLLDGIALAEEVYSGLRTPEPCDTGVVAGGPLPAALNALIRPLARHWVDTPDDLPDTGSVLLVGEYAHLRADAVQHVLDTAHATGRPLSLLTGRDIHSLSWTAAKQYARVTADAPVGVLSELDTAAPAPQADVWLGADDVHRLDVQQIALGRVWRRVLFHGNGKDDQLNLGRFTLCGASPAQAAPGMPGPRCAYGLGCTKPQDKLIPARGIRTAELVLANCFSGALAGHAMYDPKYLILLDALDGPAQTVLATLTACDGQRPENLAWLTATAGNAALAMNRQLRDINPYPAFVQTGLRSSGLDPSHPHPHSPTSTGTGTGTGAFEASGATPSSASAGSPDFPDFPNSPDASAFPAPAGAADTPGPAAAAGGAREGAPGADAHRDGAGTGDGEGDPAAPYPPLHRLGARLSGLLDSGLLDPDYPLRPRLRALADTVLRDAVRTVARSAPDAGPALAAIAAETKSLDLALAHRFAKHHDDPALAFPTYFGERSTAAAPVALDTPCACGRPLRSYRRHGRVPAIADTVQTVCARCGDVANAHAGAVALHVKAPAEAAAGSSLHVVVEAVAPRDGTLNLGIVLPLYLDARVGPVLRRVDAVAGRRAHAEFTLDLAPQATPQAYYFSPFAVQDLGVSVSRVHFTVLPRP